MTEPAVRFENITRRFPGVQALTDVSLEIAAGSCHALCGENGAGKSTLGKILAGIHKPDAGRLFIHGREVQLRRARAMRWPPAWAWCTRSSRSARTSRSRRISASARCRRGRAARS